MTEMDYFAVPNKVLSDLQAQLRAQQDMITSLANAIGAFGDRLATIESRLTALEQGVVVDPPVDPPDPPPPDDPPDEPDDPPTTEIKPIIDGDDRQWAVKFQADFDSDAIDPAQFARSYWWDWKEIGSTNQGNHELQWYLPGNCYVNDGKLILEARKEDHTPPGEKTFHYTSGIVTTGKPHRGEPLRFAFTYGYAEVRAKIPTGRGLWPAFWLLQDEKSLPEIDVFEFLGHETAVDRMHYHWSGGDKGEHYNGPDFSEAFHVFGIEWAQGVLIWRVDGKEVWRITGSHVSTVPMYILLNLAVGGDYPGAPDAQTQFPAKFEIDYVRVWQRA